jgi:putative transposase
MRFLAVNASNSAGQYTSYEFGKALRASGLLASMVRVGSAFDCETPACRPAA